MDKENLVKNQYLYCVYQPLTISSNSSTYAYESLIRSDRGTNPYDLLLQARMEGRLFELDTVCILTAIKEYPNQYFKKYTLFINIFPSTMIHGGFEEFLQLLLKQHPQIVGRVVFEINEDQKERHIWNMSMFTERIAELRKRGFGIAFDDMAVEKSTFEKIELISPDYIKLDKSKGNGLAQSHDRQELIALFLEYTKEKMKLVLEGLESEKDVLVAKQLGVPLLQGYYFSKPKRL